MASTYQNEYEEYVQKKSDYRVLVISDIFYIASYVTLLIAFLNFLYTDIELSKLCVQMAVFFKVLYALIKASPFNRLKIKK